MVPPCECSDNQTARDVRPMRSSAPLIICRYIEGPEAVLLLRKKASVTGQNTEAGRSCGGAGKNKIRQKPDYSSLPPTRRTEQPGNARAKLHQQNQQLSKSVGPRQSARILGWQGLDLAEKFLHCALSIFSSGQEQRRCRNLCEDSWAHAYGLPATSPRCRGRWNQG